MIASVEPDSAAADKGLRPGDVIEEVNQQAVETAGRRRQGDRRAEEGRQEIGAAARRQRRRRRPLRRAVAGLRRRPLAPNPSPACGRQANLRFAARWRDRRMRASRRLARFPFMLILQPAASKMRTARDTISKIPKTRAVGTPKNSARAHAPVKPTAAPWTARHPANWAARQVAFPPARVSAAWRAPRRARRPACGVGFGQRDRFDRLDPRLEIRIFGGAAREPGAFDAGLDEFLDMRRNELQPAEFLGEGHLQTPARQLVRDAEAVEIEFEDALLLVVGRIAHADMRVEAAGAPGQRLVDRLGMIGGGDRDDVGIGRGRRTAPATIRRSRRP